LQRCLLYQGEISNTGITKTIIFQYQRVSLDGASYNVCETSVTPHAATMETY